MLKKGHSRLDRGFETYDDTMAKRELSRETREKTTPDVTEAVLRWLEKKVLPTCDGIIGISREMIKHLIERIPELSPVKFIYLPNGISVNEIVELRG